MADKAKRSFEFRMSKKVAELTQVVHMLFTRNHEKEVEVDALKEAYEHEMQIVIGDGRRKLSILEDKVVELERKLERERNTQKEKVETAVIQQAGDRDEEWRRKLVAAEKALQEEKLETQHMRDLLINAQKDIEKLRQKVEENMNSKSDEIERRDREMDRIRKQCADLERTLKENDRQSRETISNLEKNNEKLEDECLEMQSLLEETHRIKEQLASRVKQLESELRSLKRDFQKKVSDVVQQNHIVKVPRSAPTNNASFSDYHDELEKLRAEVRRYRLELHNRDNNFNRMFTDTQPLIVDPRAGRIGVSSGQAINQSVPTSHTQVSPLSIHGRERSFSYALVSGYEETTPLIVDPRAGRIGVSSGQAINQSVPTSHTQVSPLSIHGRERSFSYALVSGYEETTKRPSSRVSSAASGKLPSLSAEQRARLTKLMKPRPLSKEMLYSK